MNKTDLMRSMREFAKGDWINKRQLRNYLRCNDEYRDEIIDGLDYRPQGAQKLYFVGDVAERLKLYIVKGGV